MTEVSTALATVTAGTEGCRHQGSPLPLTHNHTHTDTPTISETLRRSVMDPGQQAVTHMEGSVRNRRTRPACLLCLCAHVHDTVFVYDRDARPARLLTVCLCQRLTLRNNLSTLLFLFLFFHPYLMLSLFSFFFRPGDIFNSGHSTCKALLRPSSGESTLNPHGVFIPASTHENQPHYFGLLAVRILT